VLRIELRNSLDKAGLAEIQGLLDDTRRVEGHDPVGEHKASHLAVGARGWVGILAFDDDRLVGYAHTRWNAPGATPRMAVEVVVHPSWQDPEGTIARRLLDETRAVLGRAGGGLLFLWVHRVEEPSATLAARLGFRVQRELAYMVRDLASPPVLPQPRPGVQLRPFRPGIDERALLEVNNAAFVGHPENGGWTLADLAERTALHWFEPDGVICAWRGERLLGFHWTKWHGHEADDTPAHEPVGEVYVLAVAPSAAGLGLGRTLLAAGLGRLHDRGCRRAILYVDLANAAARTLYTSDGFVTRYSEVCYAEDVWPLVDARTAELLRPA